MIHRVPEPMVVVSIMMRRFAPGMWSSNALSDEVVDGLLASNLPVVHFDLRAAKDKDGVLRALGDQGGFPDYYGRNWDAAYDCLTDLEPAVVLVRGVGTLDSSTVDTLSHIFGDAAAHWRHGGLTTYVVWDGPASAEAPPLPIHGV